MLSRIANFDDLDPLKAEPQVEVVFVPPGERAAGRRRAGRHSRLEVDDRRPRCSSARMAGTATLPSIGGAAAMSSASAAATRCSAACVRDPTASRAASREAEGLGLLDVETVMEPEKTVRNVTARSLHFDVPLTGYEIHLGRTTGPDCLRPSAVINGVEDGATSADGKVFGTYLHGLFSSDAFRAAYLESLGIRGGSVDYRAEVERALDAARRASRKAPRLRRHLRGGALRAAAAARLMPCRPPSASRCRNTRHCPPGSAQMKSRLP